MQTIILPQPTPHPCVVKSFGEGSVILTAPANGSITRITLDKDGVLHVDAQHTLAWDSHLRVEEVYETPGAVKSAVAKTVDISKKAAKGFAQLVRKMVEKASSPTTAPLLSESPSVDWLQIARSKTAKILHNLREFTSIVLGKKVCYL
jgi:hypothetical protein